MAGPYGLTPLEINVSSVNLTPSQSLSGIKRLLKLLLAHPYQLAFGLLGIVVSDCVQLVVPLITKHVVDRLELHDISATSLIGWGCLILFLGVISFFSKQIWRHLILGASKKSEFELRRQLLEKTLYLSIDKAKSLEAGKFMSLASNDIPAIGQALAFGVIALFDSIFLTLLAAIMMFRLSPKLTALTLIPFPLLAFLMTQAMRLIYRRWDKVQSTLESLTEKTRESISAMRTLRSYLQASGNLKSFAKTNDAYLSSTMSYVRVDASFSPLIFLFSGSSSALLLFFGGQMVLDKAVSIGTLAAFTGYLGILTWPMIAAGWMLVLLQRGLASIDRLAEVLDSPGENSIEASDVLKGELKIDSLSFSYPTSNFKLHEWSLSCKPGQIIGIVGPVGSGKSTLLRLLQALEPIPAGAITIAGQDLSLRDQVSVRRLFSPVSQEPFLFSDTIANNLRLANPSAADSEIKEALEIAHLADDLKSFPLGINTLLGERGVSLSGGQRQRTALARAWLKPAPFLLLDDTLSAVDALTETRILSSFREHPGFKERGLIVVSHRLSAVRHADEIIVAKDGYIVDRGTHDELSVRPGLYSEMLSLQILEDEPLG